MKFNFYTNSFEDQNINGNKIAITSGEENITWSELEREVQKLEDILLPLKKSDNDCVIIYGHKEILFPVSILTLIKNNITYVAVDSVYPEERVKHIANECGCNILINCTNSELHIGQQYTVNNSYEVTQSVSDDIRESKLQTIDNDPVRYILFTSGSTGVPKGVQITRESLNTFLKWLESDYDFSDKSVFIAQASFSFDISMYDILGTFHFGGQMLLVPKSLGASPVEFTNYIKKNSGTTLIATPSFIYRLLRYRDFNSDNLPEFKQFLLLGEELRFAIIKGVINNFDNSIVINGYGPTEATIATTMHLFDKNNYMQFADAVPIGTSVKGGLAFTEDREATKENPSEILLVGDHVSVGYLNNPEKNREKFFIHNGQRAFRTGDLGYEKDGLLYYCGRMDDLIKMHGYRIELGEISSHIESVDIVNKAVTTTVTRNGEIKRIISFAILNAEVSDNETACKTIVEQISKKLPEYMIPGDIMIVDTFPVNNNGKTDKNRLLDMYRNR